MSWTNEQVAILIEEYEKYPALYTVKHQEYHNKHRRNLYLQKIASVLKSTRPNTTEADIHKKFTGLRNTYASERRKFVESVKSGSGSDDVYKPSLWYYDSMQYLNSHLGIRRSKANLYIDTISAQAAAAHSEEGQEPDTITVSEPRDEERDASETEIIFSPEARDGTAFEFGHSSSVSPSPTPRKRQLIRGTEVLDSSATDCLQNISSAMETISGKKTKSVELNQDAVYAAYVQTRLECITDKMRKVRVKHAIDNLLYDAIEEEANN